MLRRWADWIRSGDWAHENEAKIPVLPGRVHELTRLANDPDASIKDVARLVAGDPVLAMQVIRMANSAMSAPSREITDITEAVGRLGTISVRNLVIASCLSAEMADPAVYGRAGAAIVDHSIGTALITLELAERRQAGELFLGGLLHDIGKLLILKLAYDTRALYPELTEAEIADVMAERHARMGGWLAARWHLPEALADLIAWHHEPQWAGQPRDAAIVHAASRLAHRYGFGGEPPVEEDVLADPVFQHLEIDAARLASLDASASDLFRTARAVFGRRT